MNHLRLVVAAKKMAVTRQNLPGFAGIGARKTVFLCRESGRKTGAAKILKKTFLHGILCGKMKFASDGAASIS